MAITRGLAFLSNFVSKTARKVDSALDTLKDKVITARVVDISLNSNSSIWSENGEWQGIGTIQFQVVSEPTSEDSVASSKLNIAKPLFPNNKNYPLVNEIVLLVKLTDRSAIESISGATSYYYFTPLSIWNHPEQNAYPNPQVNSTANSQKADYQQIEAGNTRKVADESEDLNLNGASGGTFIENGNIHPILPFSGDYILEGRFGNSIRLGNTSTVEGLIQNNWSKNGDDGNPITIIRNGQNPKLEPPGWIPTTEDINEDLSSVYLTSNQIVLNSGRLVFNSNADSIIISSQKNVSINSNEEIGISGEKKITLLSNRVNLGDLNANQSVVLGDDFMDQFELLLQNVSNLASALTTSLDWPGGAPVPSPNIPPIASTVQSQVGKIMQVVKKGQLLSKVSKTI